MIPTLNETLIIFHHRTPRPNMLPRLCNAAVGRSSPGLVYAQHDTSSRLRLHGLWALGSYPKQGNNQGFLACPRRVTLICSNLLPQDSRRPTSCSYARPCCLYNSRCRIWAPTVRTCLCKATDPLRSHLYHLFGSVGGLVLI